MGTTAFDPGKNVDSDYVNPKGKLQVGEIRKIFNSRLGGQEALRHSLWVKNKSTTDPLWIQEGDGKSIFHITVDPNSEKMFDPHLVGSWLDQACVTHYIMHCEIEGEVWLQNGGANPIAYEIMEVY